MNLFFRKLSWLLQRRRKEAELREELQFHLDAEAEERQEAGLAQEQARWAAHRELGNRTLLQENIRAVWIWTFLEQLMQDVRYALRMMFKNRAFTLLAALSLALGIGANTVIFSFMDSILLRSLPVSDPASLVVLTWHIKALGHTKGGIGSRSVVHGMHGSTYDDPTLGYASGIFPFPFFELLQQDHSPLSDVFAFYPVRKLNVIIKGQADIANGEYVSGDYFRGIGVPPAAGRLIAPDDDRAGTPAVAVVSTGFSERYFGGAANATGQTILLNNVLVTVVGVTPAEFFGVDPSAAPSLYLPMHTNVLLDPSGFRPARYLDQNEYWIEIMARLRPGINQAQAQAALAPQFHRWVESIAANDLERSNLPALAVQEGAGGLGTLRRRYSKPLYILLGLVGLILAIACANIANLLLARATARRGEMALRLSLGAGRLRLVRQLLTESVLLASLGGVLGVFVAVWGIRFLTMLLANGQTDFTFHANLNWHVLGVAAALSLLTGVLFGLAPALQSTRVDVLPALKKIRPGDARSQLRVSLSHTLVVSQIALSLLMLVAAGLFVRTLSNLQSVELGFNPENVLLFKLNARHAGHQSPEITSFYGDLQKRLSVLPGVRSVSLANASLIGEGQWSTDISVSDASVPGATFLAVGPGYFTTMQIPILLGRAIDGHDQPDSSAVAVVNELFAQSAFGKQDPIGRHITFAKGGKAEHDLEIVGVTKNARYGDLKEGIFPVVYIPFNQGSASQAVDEMTYVLRANGDPLHYVNTVREVVHQADSRVPVTSIKTQSAQIDQIMNQEIIFGEFCTAFAILALVIACVGLYGTMSYNVARRTGEIGIRMALGAQRGVVVWMVLREVFVLAAVGLMISVPVAFATSKLIKSFLFGMKPNDPLALTAAMMTLLGAALLAGYLPARKASRIDPMIALRHE